MRLLTAITIGLLLVPALGLHAQRTDSTAADTLPSHFWRGEHRNSGIRITSGGTYNRVEGLPVLIGPWIRDTLGGVTFRADVLGIVRSANGFRWDSPNVGHSVTLDARRADPAGRGWNINLSSFDIVDAVEPWQMSGAESGLATFFFHRDYRDYYGRHGAKASAALMMSARSSFAFALSDERWATRAARDVFTVWKNGAAFRANPTLDGGRFRIATAQARLDSRNNPESPATGLNLLAEYETGSGRVTSPGAISTLARATSAGHIIYGRLLLDLRDYTRISPATQINARLVLGGWLHGDPLPMERRLSVGGVATLPGYDFRDATLPGADVFQCNSGVAPVGLPAQCDRIALAQIEYRSQLHAHFLDVMNSRPIRIRGVGLTVRPTAVVFVDAGRGWLVGNRVAGLRYGRAAIPPFGTFRTDVGVGLDLGLLGVYAAKAVSVSKEPANVFVRVSRRF
ncbi:MAG: hypothetical protein M3Z17_09425 [Gemmatimonadota bacterium]|nr:hypothetical protein [Gemmatimonadota bacterium]